jgi:hypothetical protein
MIVNEQRSLNANPEQLQQALHFLLLRYSKSPSPSVAGRIVSCLEDLLAHPHLKVAAHERCTYRQMRTYWRLVETLG